jgi:hypothetical protein
MVTGDGTAKATSRHSGRGRMCAAGVLHRGAPSQPSWSPLVTVNIVLLQPLIALIAGILILLVPRLLNYIVAIYLILVGLSGLLPHFLR